MSEVVERKSELRIRLDGELFKRAKPAKDGEINYGVDTWKIKLTNRWAGDAWYRDYADVVVRVTFMGIRDGHELGERLLKAIEAFEVPK